MSELLKQFLGKGYTWWFVFAFPAVVRAGILNLFMVPVITHLLFTKDTVESLTSTDDCGKTGRPV